LHLQQFCAAPLDADKPIELTRPCHQLINHAIQCASLKPEVLMNRRLAFIKYSVCAFVFASAAAMDMGFSAKSMAANGNTVANALRGTQQKQLTKSSATPPSATKVTIGSL
jgi:hypothetical protein